MKPNINDYPTFNQWSIFLYRNIFESGTSISAADYGSVIGVNDGTLDNGWIARTYNNSVSRGGVVANVDSPADEVGDPTMSSMRFSALNSTMSSASGASKGFTGIHFGAYNVCLDLTFKFDTGPTYPIMQQVYLKSYSGSKLLATFSKHLVVTAQTNSYYAQLNGIVHFTDAASSNNGMVISVENAFGSTNDWVPTAGRLAIAKV